MRPRRLNKGDTVGVIAPAGPTDKDELLDGISFLNSLGLHVKLGKHVLNQYGYLAGSDQNRLEDLHAMFADKDVSAIFCARGGYGTARIAPYINYHLIANNPKIFWGYSDITFLHTAIRQMTGLVTFHGPMVSSDFSKDDFDYLSKQMFDQLFYPATLLYTDKISPLKIISHGEACGEIVGGNLSVLINTLGTRFELDTSGKLLLLEDVGEEPYRIDAFLNQLKLAGKIDAAAGIILGDFNNVAPKKSSFTLDQVLHQYFQHLHKPVISGLKIGHCFPHFSIPLGVEAKLSTTDKTLLISPGIT
ncbi:LD-carboxypeptidase [Aquibacillus koreensis]|uniref:LD-carboxypeptidase n=1 Tax=Aquibacillus koreensis TaxID=279446 RepID=A0A9X3WLV5_9BACI|nr:LD-carboxypeptidase [Aquibacillus koreensis]MCT2535101.1 LD-carboxypeptidase [Aquibacillus koreensis]MDC3419744.1 LD-carboxypeptidase [Aquibacillus koreensis]